MAVTIHDVQHIATLARLGLPAGRAEALAGELNTILGHMDVLSQVDTEGVEEAIGVGAHGLPVRADTSGCVSLVRPLESMAPAMRDGFYLVPRLATHEAGEDA